MLPAINLRRVPHTGAETSVAETPVPRCPSAEKSQRRIGERRNGGAETAAPKCHVPREREWRGPEGKGKKGGKRRERGKGRAAEGGGEKEGIKGRERVGWGNWCPFPHGATTCLRHAPASIAAAEKRPLSYQTPQSVHMVRNCGAQTLPLTMHYRGKKWGKIGEGMVGF